jgi:hypothetical protein
VECPLWREDGSAVCSAITRWSESLRTRNHTLLSHLRLPPPKLEGQVPVCIFPRNRVAQLYPRALGYSILKFKLKLKFKLYHDRRSVGQSVLVLGTHLGPAAIFFLLFLIILRHLLALLMTSLHGPYRKQRYSELSWCCDRRSVGLSVFVSGTPLGTMTRFSFFFLLLPDNCCALRLGTPSLTRGQVCNL